MPAQISLRLENRILYNEMCIYGNWVGCAPVCHLIRDSAAALQIHSKFKWSLIWIVCNAAELHTSFHKLLQWNYGITGMSYWLCAFSSLRWHCRETVLRDALGHNTGKETVIEEKSVTNLQLTFLLQERRWFVMEQRWKRNREQRRREVEENTGRVSRAVENAAKDVGTRT